LRGNRVKVDRVWCREKICGEKDANESPHVAIVRRNAQGCRGGDAACAKLSGDLLSEGQGVQQDNAEAVKWFRRAADSKRRCRQVLPWLLLQSGTVCRRSFAGAKWFREAARGGDPAAQFNLGVLYETGQGCPKIYAEAVSGIDAGQSRVIECTV